jgi:hypothetical protein
VTLHWKRTKELTLQNVLQELNYSDQRGCEMVPIVCDAVTPRRDLLSGQVGLITSGLIYVDFSEFASSKGGSGSTGGGWGGQVFQAKMDELVKALGDRGKIH